MFSSTLQLIFPFLFSPNSNTTLTPPSLSISTHIGTITGFVNTTAGPNVAQFLGIPYAEPPIGPRRWLPSIPKTKVEGGIEAKAFSPSCPQIEPPNRGVYSIDAREFLIGSGPNSTSEDCLTLNIWAPFREVKERTSEKLPVIVWLYGGAFQSGGGNTPYQIPTNWVQRKQKHIVVGINYRTNIFGFPNAAGLNEKELNLGLLDQRLGIDWIRDNIANFGGDAKRITLWGQSAGAASVDYYNYAYAHDPIVSGLILNSGTALIPLSTTDPNRTNFTFVAQKFGCGNVSPTEELNCLRRIPQQQIEDLLKSQQIAGQPLSFSPIVDSRTKFANYTARTLTKDFTLLPAILGTNANEGAALAPFKTDGPEPRSVKTATESAFLCPAARTSQLRYAAGTKTYRYLYAGNFSNIAPRVWEGAYHSAELPLIFGTSGIVRGESTAFEVQVSERMQDLWVAFAEDPVAGLEKMGWESYRPGDEGKALVFGREGVVAGTIGVNELDKPCSI